MCLSCVSPLQSVMDYWCSTDVTNKDYPCAAVCVPALPFPPCPGAVRTSCTAPRAPLVSSKHRPGPGSRAAQPSDAEVGCRCIAVAAGRDFGGRQHTSAVSVCASGVLTVQSAALRTWAEPVLFLGCGWYFAATKKLIGFISDVYSKRYV